MIDLKELTILIALKVDSEDRINNLDIVFNYLQNNFNTNIIISEQDESPKLEGRYNCNYVFLKTSDFFNRQRGVNLAAKKATTPVIAHYDADILLRPNQIYKATQLILNKDVDIVYPYDGKFYDVPKHFHRLVTKTKALDCIRVDECTLFNPHSVGGVVFFNRDVFWAGGGANENFKGLGYEDNEIFNRFTKLGYNIGRLNYPLFHLTHVRKDTSFNFNPYLESNKTEFFRVDQMSKEDLQKEVATWSWAK